MRYKLLLILVALLLVSASAQAVTVVTTADGSGADAYIGNDSKSSPSSNHGSATTVECRYNGGGSRFRAFYLRFDLTGVSEADVSGSFLTLDATYLKSSTGRTLEVFGLADGDDDNWDESTITYNNAPGMLAAGLGDYAIDGLKLSSLGTISTPPSGSPYPVTFNSNTTDLSLGDFITANSENTLLTFVFIETGGTSGTNCEAKFATKEHADYGAPSLTLIPEPATMLLLGIGSVLAMRRRK